MAIDILRRAEPAGEPSAPLPERPQRSPRQVRPRRVRLPLYVQESVGVSVRLLALGTYAVTVALVALRHEPWFDEAQAWLLARDASLWDLLVHQLRYEGSPPLWHLLLMGPAKLSAPYATLTVIAVLIAIAGAGVLVLRAPFPLPLTVGLLFSFVIAYQYAVVARSYVLVPLLLFLLAITWPRRLAAPWPFVAVLTLLAATSVHGMLISGGVFAVHLLQLLWPIDRVSVRWDVAVRQLRCGLVFALACAVMVVQLWPAPDQSLGAGFNPSGLNLAVVAPAVLNSALTGSPILSLVAVALSAWWFRRTRTLLLWALPTALVLTLAAVKYHNNWHDGVPFLLWIFALWVSFAQGPVRPRRGDALARWGALVALAGVVVVQAGWLANTVRYDWTYPYSGSRELAAWLQRQPQEAEIYAIGFQALAALPYLAHNPYDNHHGGRRPAYMHWSTDPWLRDDLWIVWDDRPDLIVWTVRSRGRRSQPALPGYERIAVFEGSLYWKNQPIEREAYYVFRHRRV